MWPTTFREEVDAEVSVAYVMNRMAGGLVGDVRGRDGRTRRLRRARLVGTLGAGPDLALTRAPDDGVVTPLATPAARRRAPAVLATVLALAAGLAACSRSGGDSGDGSGDGPEPPDTATAPTTGLAPAVDPAGTVSHGTLTVDGRERTYRLYVPSQSPDGPVPLFVALHGGTGWGDQFAATNRVEGLAEANGFLVVHPDGVKVAGGRGGVWNGGVCCAVAAREDVDDVAFLDALVDEVAGTHDIDPARTFAFGHSNGGIMSYRLACEASGTFVGVGAVAGTLGIDTCDPAEPVSVVHVHGTADENVPITGGVGPRSVAGVDFPSPTAGFATVARAAGCPVATETTDGDVTVAARTPCDGGTAAEFVTIDGAQHPWPGASGTLTARNSGEPYPDYDATAEVVRFLLAHPRA